MAAERELTHAEYRALAEFRYQLRLFLRRGEQASRDAGLEPQQHQLLLVVKGLPEDASATVGTLAERLQLQHHSTVELINRLVDQGLVQRKRDSQDKRLVLVSLTARGERVLRELSHFHHSELRSSAPEVVSALRKLIGEKAKAHSERSGRS